MSFIDMRQIDMRQIDMRQIDMRQIDVRQTDVRQVDIRRDGPGRPESLEAPAVFRRRCSDLARKGVARLVDLQKMAVA